MFSAAASDVGRAPELGGGGRGGRVERAPDAVRGFPNLD